MQENSLDLLDQRLIHALQINPRARWQALAPILGADAVTLSRRWARLKDEGIVYDYAFGSGAGEPGLVAFVEIHCRPGESLSVAEHLGQYPEVFAIDLTAGARDLMLALIADSPASLAKWALERVRNVEGVVGLRTHMVSVNIADARGWLLRALTKDEVTAVARTERREVPPPVRMNREQRNAILIALNRDARVSATVLGDQLGMSPRRVRDAIDGMRRAGHLAFRVEVARAYTPWPISAWYFLRVPASLLAQVGPQLSKIEEVRMVVETVSEYNLIMVVWLRTLQDVSRLEAIVETRLPGTTFVDRSVVVRSAKHNGHFLDEAGRATGDIIPPVAGLDRLDDRR